MKTTVRIIVSVLILILAVASVANIHTRAVQLHANGGWQTWFISVGFAVTFAVFSYMLIAFRKTFFLAAATFGAILTGVMQTGMYLALGADWVTSLGFGCGGPILEALLAMSEHYMDEPVRKSATSPVWVRLGNAVASRIERPVETGAIPIAHPVATPIPPSAPSAATRAQRCDDLLRTLDGITDPADIDKAALGRQFGVSRTQIGKDIDKLVAAGRLPMNGHTNGHTV